MERARKLLWSSTRRRFAAETAPTSLGAPESPLDRPVEGVMEGTTRSRPVAIARFPNSQPATLASFETSTSDTLDLEPDPPKPPGIPCAASQMLLWP